MLNPNYIGEIRQTGTPMIEVLKSTDTSVNVRSTKEITNALTPSLAGYSSIKVDLTDLPMDYSIRIPVLVAGSNLINTIEDAMDKKDQAVAKAIVEATANYDKPEVLADVSKGLGEAMKGLEMSTLNKSDRMQDRGI